MALGATPLFNDRRPFVIEAILKELGREPRSDLFNTAASIAAEYQLKEAIEPMSRHLSMNVVQNLIRYPQLPQSLRPKLEAVLAKAEKEIRIYEEQNAMTPYDNDMDNLPAQLLKTLVMEALDKIPGSSPRPASRPDFKAFWFILIGLGIAACAILIRIKRIGKDQERGGRKEMMKKGWIYVGLGGLAILIIVPMVIFLNRDPQHRLGDSAETTKFYGKVIDQDQGPIEGVKIVVDITSWKRYFGTKRGKDKKFVRYSDANGRFTVENQKLYLNKHSFYKDGYISSLLRWGPGGSFLYGHYHHEYGKHHPDPDNPVLFRMWKRLPDQGPRGLIKRDRGNPHFEPDGNWYAYDLITDKMIAIDYPRADLILSARIERHAEGSEVYDLILTLKMKKGGIQKAEDPYLFLAPEDGYEQEIVWKKHYDREDRESNNRLQGGFYLHYKNLIYARIYLSARFRRYYSDESEEEDGQMDFLSFPMYYVVTHSAAETWNTTRTGGEDCPRRTTAARSVMKNTGSSSRIMRPRIRSRPSIGIRWRRWKSS